MWGGDTKCPENLALTSKLQTAANDPLTMICATACRYYTAHNCPLSRSDQRSHITTSPDTRSTSSSLYSKLLIKPSYTAYHPSSRPHSTPLTYTPTARLPVAVGSSANSGQDLLISRYHLGCEELFAATDEHSVVRHSLQILGKREVQIPSVVYSTISLIPGNDSCTPSVTNMTLLQQ